jgi:CRP/FNR family transcriptional regulator
MFSTSSKQQINNVIAISPFAASSLAGLFDRVPTEKVDEGSVLLWEGDSAKNVFEVVEGLMRIVRMTGDGRRVIIGFIFPGELLGVSAKDRYLYTAEAVVSTCVRRYSRSSLQQKMELNPLLRPNLFARLCDEMEAAQEHMVLLGCRSAVERLCCFLLMLARKSGKSPKGVSTIEVPMIRQDIADYLGLTIETVSRTFTRLTGLRVIVQDSRHSYRADLEKLARMAGNESWIDTCRADVGLGMAS